MILLDALDIIENTASHGIDNMDISEEELIEALETVLLLANRKLTWKE